MAPLANLLGKAALLAPTDYANLHIKALPRLGQEIAYHEFGDPHGKPLLCLHGLSLSGLYFEGLDGYCRENGVRIIAPSLLGGIYVADPAATIDALASALIELMDVLGIERFDVIGFSWGTLPQLALLARVPGRIGKAGLVGAMIPGQFIEQQHIDQLKPDVRMTLKMVAHMPLVHRAVMALVCKLPLAKLIEQFKDDQLSLEEQQAMSPGAALYAHFARCMAECVRTGSRFFTQAWRMFQDTPRYALNDLAVVAAKVDLRLYVAEQDNVHLPYFSAVIAAAANGAAADAVVDAMASNAARHNAGAGTVFSQVYASARCSIWLQRGAGRIACMLNFKDALQNLMHEPVVQPA